MALWMPRAVMAAVVFAVWMPAIGWARDMLGLREAQPAEVVRWFVEACVAHEGEPVAVMDWALTQGFDPLDPSIPEVGVLLGGRAGAVLRSPDATVMLATTMDGACTVWAERSIGPAVYLAWQQAVTRLSGSGARVQVQFERYVERAGVWRRQWQARYRRVGGTQELGLGLVATLTDGPAAQVFQLWRRPAVESATDPDGWPRH
ncbi:MAG: hypothetical protein KatS3mg122_0959 [Caldimonas sp.]|nr:MAG: hypothetical protein KatS3mg122_0959 [Caldimonas sp.]